MKISDVIQASGSGRAEQTTRTDSEARTRKSRFQVQVDSLSQCRLNGVFELKKRSRVKCAVLDIACAQRDSLSLLLLAE